MSPMFNPCMSAPGAGPMGPSSASQPNGPPLPPPPGSTQNGPPPGDPNFFGGPPHGQGHPNGPLPPPQSHPGGPPPPPGSVHGPPPPPHAFQPPNHHAFHNGNRPPTLSHHSHPHHAPHPTRAFMPSPDFKIYELNKRLHNRPEDCDNIWWDSFVSEFFEDDATLSIAFCLEDGPKRFTIGRTLIPRYFRSVFDGGVHDLQFNLRNTKENFSPNVITLDCDHCSMVTFHGKTTITKPLGPFPPDPKDIHRETSVVVHTEGRLVLEFTYDEMMRIRTWQFSTRQHQELVVRNLVALHAQQQDPGLLDQLTKNITRQGVNSSTLNYLRLCVILEPMQLLMSRHKALGTVSPRDCLKNVLFDRWQRTIPETQRPTNKRRKRKSSAAANAGTGTTTGAGKKKAAAQMSPGTPNFSLASQDVMVVGEPSLMGGEFGEEDERIITRLENTQYDSNALGSNGLDEAVDEFVHANNPANGQSHQNGTQGPPSQGPPSTNGPTTPGSVQTPTGVPSNQQQPLTPQPQQNGQQQQQQQQQQNQNWPPTNGPQASMNNNSNNQQVPNVASGQSLQHPPTSTTPSGQGPGSVQSLPDMDKKPSPLGP